MSANPTINRLRTPSGKGSNFIYLLIGNIAYVRKCMYSKINYYVINTKPNIFFEETH